MLFKLYLGGIFVMRNIDKVLKSINPTVLEWIIEARNNGEVKALEKWLNNAREEYTLNPSDSLDDEIWFLEYLLGK
jgi:hypothetical protein